MPLECERKYICESLITDFSSLRVALQEHNAVCEGAHLESNSLWDSPQRHLRPLGTLLRLRAQQWFDITGQCRQSHILTLKTAANEQQGCKIREESEVCVDDAPTMESILSGLGYEITARYEKVREVWQLHGAELALDILPFGNFIEVEGTVEDIEAAARLVGLDSAPQTTASYHRLHQDWRQKQDLPPAVDFVFDAEKRAALIRYLQDLAL